MARALLAACRALRQRGFAHQSFSQVPHRPITNSSPATAKSHLVDRAPGIDAAVNILRKEFGSQILGLRSSMRRMNHGFGVLTRNMVGVKTNFHDLKGEFQQLSTKFNSLSEQVTGLSQQVTGLSGTVSGLSEKFTRFGKSVAIIKWEMNALLVTVIGFTGGMGYIGKLGWDFFAGDFGDALRAVMKQYLATKADGKK